MKKNQKTKTTNESYKHHRKYKTTVIKANSIISDLKGLLLMLELAHTRAIAEIQTYQAAINLLSCSMKKADVRKAEVLKIKARTWEIYAEDVKIVVENVQSNIENLLNLYCPSFQRIFWLSFFEEKTAQEVANITNFSLSYVTKVIKKLKDDLKNYFVR